MTILEIAILFASIAVRLKAIREISHRLIGSMLKELSHAKNEVLCHALIHLQHEVLIHIPVAVAVGKTAATSERETQKN